jgi:diaminobutyrate-2-oxoglutarate transaminase
VRERLDDLADRYGGAARGRGLIQGVSLPVEGAASRASRAAFAHGLLAETSGARDEVLKVLPPLTIARSELERGMDILEAAVDQAMEPRAAAGEGRR